MRRTLELFVTVSDSSPSTSVTTRIKTSETTAKANSAPRSVLSQPIWPLASQPSSVAGRFGNCISSTTSSMISLPT